MTLSARANTLGGIIRLGIHDFGFWIGRSSDYVISSTGRSAALGALENFVEVISDAAITCRRGAHMVHQPVCSDDSRSAENGWRCASSQSPPSVFVRLFDYSIGPCQHVRRERQVQSVCGVEIDDEVVSRRFIY